MPYLSQINGRFVRRGSFESGLSLVQAGLQRTGAFTAVIVADNLNQTDGDIYNSILDDGGRPARIGDVFDGAFVVDVRFSRELTCHRVTGDETYAWKLEYQIDSDIDINNFPRNPDGSLNQSGGPGNPLLLPADFDIGTEIEYSPLDRPRRDANGNRFQNRFGESLSHLVSGFETEQATNVIRIQRWGPWPTPLAQLNFYNNTTNSTAFHTLPIGTCWLNVKSRKQWYHGVEYARETYEIRTRIDPENPARENTFGIIEIPHVASRHFRLPNDPTTTRFTALIGGSRGPFFLKADGTLAETEDDAELLEFRPKRAVDWTPLNLPDR